MEKVFFFMLNFLLQNYYKIYKKEHDQSFKIYKKNSFYIIYIYIWYPNEDNATDRLI